MARPPFDQFPPHYYHHWHHHHRRFGMFRRFFWFSFGGLASLAAVRHFGYSHFAVEGGHPTDRERNWDGGWQGCRRVMYAPHLERSVHPQYAPSSQNLQSSQERPASMPMPVPVQAVTGQTIPSLPPPPVGATVPPVEQRIETGIRDLGRRAEERVTDLSESTIDSMIASLVGLKSRLSEHRAEQQHQSQQQSQASQPPSPSQGRRV